MEFCTIRVCVYYRNSWWMHMRLGTCWYVSIIIMYITMYLHILSKEVLNFYSATYDYSFHKVKV